MSDYINKRVCVLETNKFFYDIPGLATFLWNGQDIEVYEEKMVPIALEWLLHDKQQMDSNYIYIECIYDRHTIPWTFYE